MLWPCSDLVGPAKNYNWARLLPRFASEGNYRYPWRAQINSRGAREGAPSRTEPTTSNFKTRSRRYRENATESRLARSYHTPEAPSCAYQNRSCNQRTISRYEWISLKLSSSQKKTACVIESCSVRFCYIDPISLIFQINFMIFAIFLCIYFLIFSSLHFRSNAHTERKTWRSFSGTVDNPQRRLHPSALSRFVGRSRSILVALSVRRCIITFDFS